MEITEKQYQNLLDEVGELKQLVVRLTNEKVSKEIMDMVEVDRAQKLEFARKFKPFELDALEKEAERIGNDCTKPENTKDVIKRVKEQTKGRSEKYYNAMFEAEGS